MASSTRCPACAAADLEVFFEMPGVPVNCNVLFATRDEARDASRGDIDLGHCRSCGMIYNVAFDAELLTYTGDYENSLHFSPRFQEYASELAARLTAAYELDGAQVLEVGCGKGDFLTLLARCGRNRCVGFDSSYEGQQADSGVEIVRSFWDPDRAKSIRADLLVCRHVLEHIEQPGAFLASVKGALGRDAGVYFEVPDSMYTLAELGIWDIIYEHCCYFTAPSLARLFSEQDLSPTATYTGFGGQFLCLEAGGTGHPSRTGEAELDLGRLAELVERFAAEFRRKVDAWSAALAGHLDAGRRLAVWGAGSKGVTFLNTVARGDEVHAVVDINSRKLGRFVAGTGQRIWSPAQLGADPVDVVLIMNPNYRGEIEATLRELGVTAAVEVV